MIFSMGKLMTLSTYPERNFLPGYRSIQSCSASVSGGLKYHYFSSSPPGDSLNTIVRIHKTLSPQVCRAFGNLGADRRKILFQISDKVKTVITINTPKQLNYVFINDSHAATMEPREPESGYKYEDGLDYYQSVKDAGYLLFDKIPSSIQQLRIRGIVVRQFYQWAGFTSVHVPAFNK